MAKTGPQIESDVYTLLRESSLAEALTGNVYRRGLRPRDSRLEDAIVIFTGGLNEQIQTGIVTINIYVPDVDPYDNGVIVEDGRRIEELATLSQQWVKNIEETINTYNFSLASTITSDAEPDIHQHFIVIKLQFRLFEPN